MYRQQSRKGKGQPAQKVRATVSTETPKTTTLLGDIAPAQNEHAAVNKSSMSDSPRGLDELVLSIKEGQELLAENAAGPTGYQKQEDILPAEQEQVSGQEMLSLYTTIGSPVLKSEAPKIKRKISNARPDGLSEQSKMQNAAQKHTSIESIQPKNRLFPQRKVTRIAPSDQAPFLVLSTKALSESDVSRKDSMSEHGSEQSSFGNIKGSLTECPSSIQHGPGNGAHCAAAGKRGVEVGDAAAAARATEEETEAEDSDNPENRTTMKRLKNRAAVNRCRVKQKERMNSLEQERLALINENNRILDVFAMLESTGMLETAQNGLI